MKQVADFDCMEKAGYEGLYSISVKYTQHYNSLKFNYKKTLIRWILGTFLACGYILQGREINLPLDPMIFLTAIAIFSSRGILHVMFLDINIYHVLLNSSFTVNVEMEQKNICGSRSHETMMKMFFDNKKSKNSFDRIYKFIHWVFTGKTNRVIDPVIYDGLPYLACCLGLWLLAGGALSRYFYRNNFDLFGYSLDFLLPVVSVFIFLFLIRRIVSAGVESQHV